MKKMTRASQRGFTMLELMLATAVATAIVAATIPMTIKKAEYTIAEVAAAQVFTLGEAAQLYRQQEGAWPTQADGCVNFPDVVTELVNLGYLAVPLNGTAWGVNPVVSCTVNTFNVSLTAPFPEYAEFAASRLPLATVAGSIVTSSFPGSTAPLLNNVLHRVSVPGRPELNRMETAIDMNGNAITNVSDVVSSTITVNGDSVLDRLVVRNGARFCENNDTGCEVRLFDDSSFVDDNTGITNWVMRSNEASETGVWIRDVVGASSNANLFVDDDVRAGRDVSAIRDLAAGRDLTVTGQARIGNELEWGSNRALLGNDQGGSMELGGGNFVAGTGAPYIDFHYAGLSQDYNVRVMNDADGQLSVYANSLRSTGDIVANGNIQAVGRMGAQDFVLAGSGRSLGQAVTNVALFSDGDIVPIPPCQAGMVPQIFTSVSRGFQAGETMPMYQVSTRAEVASSNSWRVHMDIDTQAGRSSAGPGAAILVQTKCE